MEESKNESHGLMLLDLDGFKHVNDSFGHNIGDQLLIEAAKRLKYAVGDRGFVARWGGDEFTVLQTNFECRADFTSLVELIKDVISEPFMIAGNTIFISASIGMAFSLEDGDTVEALIKNADAAMYRVKNQAKDMSCSQN